MRNHSLQKWMTCILPVLILAGMIGCDKLIPEKIILLDTYDKKIYPVMDLDYGSVCYFLADSLVFGDSLDSHLPELIERGWILDTSFTMIDVEKIVYDTTYTDLDSTDIDTITQSTELESVEVFKDILASRDLGEPMALDTLVSLDDLSGVPELLSNTDADSHLVIQILDGKGCFIFDNSNSTDGRFAFYFDDYVNMQIWEITENAAGDLIVKSSEEQNLQAISDCKFKKTRFEYVLPPEKVLMQIEAQGQTIKLHFPMVISIGE